MGKYEDYGMLAEKYYVEEQLPVSKIVKKLNLTDKTLHDWRKKGDWDNKREAFLKSQFNCYANLYQLANLVINKAVETAQSTGELPDSSTLNFIKAMADKLPKLKSLESEMALEKISENEKTDDALSTIDLVDNYLNGLN